jgi:cobalt transport protein ATP-binding subunit
VEVSGGVEVNNLCYHYADGTEALRDVSFTVAHNECAAIIGPNGAGKSTLLLHLNGLLPDARDASGTVAIDGAIVSRATAAEIRRKVGLLFQDPDDQLFCATVYEDVAFGPMQFGLNHADISQRVRDALARVGLAGFEKRAPHRLSGGEKRRVCLAGVLACEPSVLVLDEPTGGLDPRGRREFKTLLRAIPATKIIATHDLEMVVELCSRVIVMDGGSVVAQGPTVELLNDEALMLKHGLERPHILQHRHPHSDAKPQA